MVQKAVLKRMIAISAVALTCVSAQQARAIVISGGTGTNAPANDTAPAGFEDVWDRVGQGLATGVYMGNGYVLSARHVSTGSSYAFNGTSYDVIPGTSVTLKNADNSEADLRLFRIAVPQGTGLDGLEPLPVLSASVATNANPETGVLIGTGVGQTVPYPTILPVGDFDETDRVGPGGIGFEWDTISSRDKRWVEIEIGQATTVEVAGRESQAFESVFNINSDPDGIASDRDSGAPLFYDDNGEIVLAGIVNSVTALDFSKNNHRTFLSDLSFYHDQLQFTTGDLDGDGGVDEDDLALVLDHYGQAVQAGNYLLGDADGDGLVGVNDLDYVLARWGDGVVAAPSAAPELGDITPAVPEPASLLLIGTGLALTALRRRR
jgi:hypothetical protein